MNEIQNRCKCMSETCDYRSCCLLGMMGNVVVFSHFVPYTSNALAVLFKISGQSMCHE